MKDQEYIIHIGIDNNSKNSFIKEFLSGEKIKVKNFQDISDKQLEDILKVINENLNYDNKAEIE